MKKQLFVLLALLGITFSSGVAHAIPDPQAPGEIKRIIGARQAVPNRVYKLVRFSTRTDNAVVLSADAVVYDTNSDDGVTVRLTTTSGDGAFAGIAVTTIQSPETGSTSAQDDEGLRNWGYICVHGPIPAKIAAGGVEDSAMAAGDPFITSTDSGAIGILQSIQPSIDALSLRERKKASNTGGFFLDDPGSTDTVVEVFVKAE